VIFLDTFLRIAASYPRNAASPSLLTSMPNGTGVIGAHPLAKLDALIPRAFPPLTALWVLEAFLQEFTAVALEPEEYLAAGRDAAHGGHGGGKI
jgi:hypothetical protein